MTQDSLTVRSWHMTYDNVTVSSWQFDTWYKILCFPHLSRATWRRWTRLSRCFLWHSHNSPTDSASLDLSPTGPVSLGFTNWLSLLGPSPADSVCWGLHQQIQSQSGPGPYTRALTGALHLHLGPSQGHVTLQGKWQVCQVSSLRRQCVILQRPPVVCICWWWWCRFPGKGLVEGGDWPWTHIWSGQTTALHYSREIVYGWDLRSWGQL